VSGAGAELLERCAAAGVTVAESDPPGRLALRWPSEDVARALRPELLEHRSEVLEALKWERCERCSRRAPRRLPAYWREDLCSDCVSVAVAEFDAAGEWPPEPAEWATEPQPPPPRPAHPRRARWGRRSSWAQPFPRPTFTPRPGPPPPGPLRHGGSAECPACRPNPWSPERLCGSHRAAWARGAEAARRALEVAA
jgi:hypothetical protein